ncbi:MAG: hypothetical protein Q8P95_01630 [bacterium]|nr:hypothetical protein [bacterium]
MDQTVSAKELRLNMKEIKDRVLEGQSFVWIYNSQPIADIVPRRPFKGGRKWDMMKELAKIRKMMKNKTPCDAVALVRNERD